MTTNSRQNSLDMENDKEGRHDYEACGVREKFTLQLRIDVHVH